MDFYDSLLKLSTYCDRYICHTFSPKSFSSFKQHYNQQNSALEQAINTSLNFDAFYSSTILILNYFEKEIVDKNSEWYLKQNMDVIYKFILSILLKPSIFKYDKKNFTETQLSSVNKLKEKLLSVFNTNSSDLASITINMVDDSNLQEESRLDRLEKLLETMMASIKAMTFAFQ